MYKLFIADDEAIIREGLRCLLDWETLGFTIAGEAANGDAALQFLLSETPDLVLLDIRMQVYVRTGCCPHCRGGTAMTEKLLS